MKPVISMIAAMSKNRVIGVKNTIPWKLSEDMKHFRELTTGKPVIMGRKTYESIGRPLPKRTNIIITRDKNYKVEGCIIVHSSDEAIKAAEGHHEIMIMGGAEIYKQFLPIANRLYLTFIETEVKDGDAIFPQWNHSEWKQTHKEEHKSENGLKFSFVTLERIH